MSPAHLSYQDPARPVDERYADLLAHMTLTEKIGQLSQVLATAGNLEPGQAQRVSFELGPDELGYWGPEGRFVVEPGEFRVWAGGDCAARLQAFFHVEP